MTITAEVHCNGQTERFTAAGEAEDAVRFKFNPSALPTVTRVKMLTSLLVAEIDNLKAGMPMPDDETPYDLGAQEILAEARRFAVSASMWTVLGATKGL
jgi:hypothetical protein